MPGLRIAKRLLFQQRRAVQPLLFRPRIQRRPLHGADQSSHNGEKSYQLLTRCVLALGTFAAAAHMSKTWGMTELYAETKPMPAEIEIEKPTNTKNLSKEETRSAISSQHHQVIRSWENPGVYAWGSNSGRVAAPDSDETLIKLPRRIAYFDGSLLRDIKLDKELGAAVTEEGDLLQWGTGFSKDARQPTYTLKGKGLTSITLSRDRIIGLGSSGIVYSIPVSQEEQMTGSKPHESSWIPFWTSRSNISYQIISTQGLAWGEKVSAIASGLEHLLLLTSKGRVFGAAANAEVFPSRGEIGVPGLNRWTCPPSAFAKPHELTTLNGFQIASIAAGDYHSLALDTDGRVFAFGENTTGQLGLDPKAEIPYVDAPSLLPFSRLYSGTNLQPHVTSIAAGGSNSFFTVDATRIAGSDEESSSPRAGLGRVTADTWSCGQGILGTLGTGRWTHVQGTPAKIKSLSGLFEWDEVDNRVIPIRLKRLSVGHNHASATMDNVTHVHAGATLATDSRNDTNWGADVVWWGGNEFYQLGMGKRSNVSLPGYIAPLDGVAERERAKRKEEHRFQITPRHKVVVGGGAGGGGRRKVSVEQRVECGRMVSAVYSGT